MQSHGTRVGRRCAFARRALIALTAAVLASVLAAGGPVVAGGRHASMAIDANTGAVLHEQAADEPRYPASLTKMMTLYIVFEQMEQGRLTRDTRIRISEDAAGASPSKLGLREGADIALADAMRAIIVKSANDISVAVAEHIAGTEEKFAQLMTRKARQLGMTRTTFRNAHGLPDPGQRTTARDMLTLALRLNDDFPQHYRLFSTRAFSFNGVSMRNHNTMLATYEGMDGIKTGYTSASGFNLVASVRRDGRHVVAAVLGGSSAAARNVYMRAILDRALRRAATERTREKAPRPALVARERRQGRPVAEAPAPKLVEPVRPVVRKAEAVRTAAAPQLIEPPRRATVKPVAATPRAGAEAQSAPGPVSHWSAPVRAPSSLQVQAERLERGRDPAPPAEPPGRVTAFAAPGLTAPSRIAGPPQPGPPSAPVADSGGGAAIAIPGVAIQVGAYASEAEAQKFLAVVRGKAPDHLAGARMRTQAVASGERKLWRARFVGLDERRAAAACSDLRRQQLECLVVRE